MPQVDNSTISLLKDWEGVRYKAYNDTSGNPTIGVGHLITPTSQTFQGIELLTGTLNAVQVDTLLNQDLTKSNGYATQVTNQIQASLTQDQFNALVLFTYNLGSLKRLGPIINQYKDDLLGHEPEISDVWKQYIYSTNRFTGTKTVNPELVVRRNAECDLFFGSYLGSAGVYRQQKGKLSAQTPSQADIEGDDTVPLSTTDLNNDFKQINQNIENIEQDDNVPGVIWGQRNNVLEAFDWIGLKQYLLYLCSTYYPESLVPFIELIPKFFTDTPFSVTDNASSDATNESVQNNSFSNPIGLDKRFTENALRQNAQTQNGGIDLLTIDPFQETTDQLNHLNDAGKEFYNKRGFGYKLFGMISLSPSVQGTETSKAGTVGFTSIEIEGGSQVNNNMSLITIEMLDVQGNKFLDINSPWSFILNSRPHEVSSDFYFRYGWQVRIPNTEPTDTSDIQGKKFWNHPGWGLFDTKGGQDIKNYISSIAKTCDNTITLTQSSNNSSFQTPGYMINQQTGFFELNQQTRQLGFENYLTLTLRNPEIKVNQNDGSVTGVLYFMNVSTVANCLCPMVYAKNMQSLVQKIGRGKTDLLTFMASFFADNNAYFKNPDIKKQFNISQDPTLHVNSVTTTNIYGIKETNIDTQSVASYISVIGSVPKTDGTETQTQQQNNFYPLLDPSTIPIQISNDQANKLYRILQSKDNSETLIGWVNGVLQDNYCTTLSAVGQITSGADLTNNFIIAYEYDKAKLNPNISKGIRAITNISKDNYQSRLGTQDDVFSFRFRGSLVEELSIEKLETPSQFQIQVGKQLGQKVLQDPKDITNKNVKNIAKTGNVPYTNATDELSEGFRLQAKGLTTLSQVGLNKAIQGLNDNNSSNIVYFVSNEAVTYVNKREYLAMLYSQMMGCNIKCLAHPWIKIGLPIGIKGTGFFDGPYLVTKIKHSLNTDNKFVSEISGCRIINQNEFQKQQDNLARLQEISQNKPSLKITEAISPYSAQEAIFAQARKVLSPSNPIKPTSTQTPAQQTEIKYAENQAILKKIKSNAKNEWEVYDSQTSSSNIIQIQKYQSYNNHIDDTSQNKWNFDFVNWCIKKALGLFDIYTPSIILSDINQNTTNKNLFPSTITSNEELYNQFLSQGNIMTDISGIVNNSTQNTTNLTFTPDDLLFMFFKNGGILKDNTTHEENIFIGIITNYNENSSVIVNNQNYGLFDVVFGDYIDLSGNYNDKNTSGVLKNLTLQLNNPSIVNFNTTKFGSFLGFGVI